MVPGDTGWRGVNCANCAGLVPGDTGRRGVTWANCAGLVAGAGDSNDAGHGDVVGWLLAAVPSVVSVVAGGDENLTCVDSGDCAVSMLGTTISVADGARVTSTMAERTGVSAMAELVCTRA
jgi:hypothetical protein